MDYQKESDARIVSDDLLRKAGWNPTDKSMVETEVLVNWPAGKKRDSIPMPDSASPSPGQCSKATVLKFRIVRTISLQGRAPHEED